MEKTPAPENLDLMIQSAQERLNLQLTTAATLETKAGGLLGFEAIVFVALLTRRAAVFGGNTPFFQGSLLLIFLSLALAFVSLRIESYRIDPNPAVFYQKYALMPLEEVKVILLGSVAEAFEHNQEILASKLRWLEASLLLLLLGLLVLVVGSLITEGVAP